MTSSNSTRNVHGDSVSGSENQPFEYSSDEFESVVQISRDLRDATNGADRIEDGIRAETLRKTLKLLSDWSNQEFGDDIEAYSHWFDTHRDDWKTFSRPVRDEERTPIW